MKYLPLFVDLKDKPVLIIGGGDIASRKIQILQKVGAIIRIVARTLCPELQNVLMMQRQSKISWIGKNFKSSMLESVILVIVATNDAVLNALVYNVAKSKYILINTVDDRTKCSCIFPAIIDRDPIVIGISSGGYAPVLIRILREKLELLLPASLGLVAKLAGLWRNQVKKCIVDMKLRRRFWEKIFYNNRVSSLVEQGKLDEANQVFKNALNSDLIYSNQRRGSVILVGAGPGNAGLLTIRGLQVIQQADIILYDCLVSKDVLDLSRRDASRICVGKQAGNHLISQQNLNDFIIKLAKQGNRVVRLKGGDPFIFGRGGEELQKISESGIDFQVVPGITAGIGVSAYSGIPLTHRGYANSVTFVTGHNSDKLQQLNWKILSDNQQTVVIYMGTLNIINIRENLIYYGRDKATPVAVVSRGTCIDQKVLIGTLIELEQLTNAMDSRPILLIIGNVVRLHNKIHWFHQKNHMCK